MTQTIGINGHARVVPRTLLDALEQAYVSGDARGFTFVAADGTERFIGFRTLVDEARRRARQLQSLGLHKGDRIGVVIPEADEFVVTFLGAVVAGVVPVPLYPPLSLGRLDAYLADSARVLDVAGVDLLVTTSQVARVLWSVVPRVPSLRDLVTIDKLAAQRESTAGLPVMQPHDPVFLQFTSGSTAAPKGVVVTHASLCANTVAVIRGVGLDPEHDKTISWLPMYHDMGLIGMMLTPLVAQTGAVFIPTLSFVKKPTLWMDVVHRHRGTVTFAPNFAFARLTKRAGDADLARWDLSCLRVVGCGAEPIHAGTMRAFVERFSAGAKLAPEAMLPCYGMAEATLAISFVGVREPLRVDAIDPEAFHQDKRARPIGAGAVGPIELVSCGRPFPGHELAIFDDDGARLPERAIGEICVRGPSNAAGYFRNPEATRALFDEAGWLHTGDLGYLANGELFISGRKKDLLIVHGRNYHPQGIEWVVEEVAGIRKGNVVAFAVPGATSEELVIVAETGEADVVARKAIAQDVKRHVTADLALVVGDVRLLDPGQLPKTTSGKVQRSKTRDQYLAGTLGAEGVRSQGSAAQRVAIAQHLVASMVSRLRHRAGTLLGFKRSGPRE